MFRPILSRANRWGVRFTNALRMLWELRLSKMDESSDRKESSKWMGFKIPVSLVFLMDYIMHR